jgi:cobalamin transport system substrate-binding protein
MAGLRARPVRGRRPAAALLVGLLALACGGREPATRSTCERILVSAPSAEEIVFALGLGPRVVGVGDYCTYPPEVAGLPRVGGLFNPNLERILTLKPDTAILLPSESELGGKLERLGIGVLIVPSDGLPDLDVAVARIAERCGLADAGTRLLADLRRDLSPLPKPDGRPPVVFLSLERQAGHLEEVLSAGPQSFVGELLARAGGINLLAETGGTFPRVTLETLLGRQPDVILELQTESLAPAAVARLVADWQAFPQIPAVRDGKVFVIAGSHTVVPGPRLPQLYREIAARVRPEIQR